jgi:hypothetical protein
MRIIVNGREAGTRQTGCALCDARWGEYYKNIDNENLFFCCNICAEEFANMVKEVKKRTGWNKIDELIIEGNYYKGRTCRAKSDNNEFKFYVKFNESANIDIFNELS